MTMPERFHKSQVAIERGAVHGADSECLYAAALRAIEETRQLLHDVTHQVMTPKDKVE